MSYLVEGKTNKWEVILGLEVHAQIKSNSKLFSKASTDWGAEPNSQVELVDSGMPGALPVINEYCIDQAILTGLSLNAEINNFSIFDRKNYFYPDLPQGYQISQYKNPIVGEGEVILDMPYGSKKIGIERLHLVEELGLLLHRADHHDRIYDQGENGHGNHEPIEFRTHDRHFVQGGPQVKISG